MILQPNTLFHNRYRLLNKLGRGAFGEVWHAKDEFADLDVAIKIYIALDDLGQQEFRTEFKTVHDLNHPNILRPDHFDISDNRPYLIMSLCDGSIENKAGNMNEDDIWHLIRDIACGLSYLHSKEVIHRDIKPDNILVSNTGNYLLSDFGVSAKMQNTMRRNSTRQKIESDISGTIAYMAPELFTKNAIANKETDIWAFGATLYELLTGELLFLGQGGILQLKGAEIPDLPDKYSFELNSLVLACIRLDANVRPTSDELAKYAESKIGGYVFKPVWCGDKPDIVISWKRLFIVIPSIIIAIIIIVLIVFEGKNKMDNQLMDDEMIVDPIILQNISREDGISGERTVVDNNGNSNVDAASEDDLEEDDLSLEIHGSATSDSPTFPATDRTLDLGYGKWEGGVKDGKPHGKGSLKLSQTYVFNGVKAQIGYRLDGQFDNGSLVIGKLYDRDNNLIKTIMP